MIALISVPCILFVAILSRFATSAFINKHNFNTRRIHKLSFYSGHVSSSCLYHSDDSNSNNNAENQKVSSLGMNELQTLLRNAVRNEEFQDAGTFSDELFQRLYGQMSPKEIKSQRSRMSWRGQGAAPWLVDRLDALNYTLPTTIQINTMEAVNRILSDDNTFNDNDDDDDDNGMSMAGSVGKDMGIVVSGSTGSGKSMSFLVPLLSTLSESLFARQRIRIAGEESVADVSDDLVSRISIVTSPVVQSNEKRTLRSGSSIAIGTLNPNPTLGKSGSIVKDVKNPLALIVVPTRELGIQIAMLLYELVGGTTINMFKYKGPKGVRVGCILDDEEAQYGLKLQTDVAITMPKYVGKLIADEDLVPSSLKVVVFDEADLVLEIMSSKDLSTLFDTKSRLLSPSGDGEDDGDYVPYEDRDLTKRLTFMVGASVTESLGNLAVKSRILPEGKSYIATATRTRAIGETAAADVDATLAVGDQPKKASLEDLNVCMDSGLQHNRVLIENGTAGLFVLTRLLRQELNKKNEFPPRVVVFFPNEVMAKESIAPLRDALWGEHRLCVLLPKTGFNPITMMEQFKNNETSVMLATPNSVRGLDFPEVTHVYTLYLPTEDPREYVHLAGRVGRVGQTGSVRGNGGQVFSILKPEDSHKMDALANELGFEFKDVSAVGVDIPKFATSSTSDDDRDDDDDEDGEEEDDEDDNESLDSKELGEIKQYLEDTVTLISLQDDKSDSDSDRDSSVIDTPSVQIDEIDEDDPGFQ